MSLVLVRLGGMSPVTGLLGYRAVCCSGGIWSAGKVEELHCV